MLVLKDQQALLMKLEDPSLVLEMIPTASALPDHKQAVVVPHQDGEVRALRLLGIKAPAPIMHYYHWEGQHTPFEHQKVTSAFLTMHHKALVLNEIGTGKTRSALWAADYLMNKGLVKKVLILAPLSTLERVWGDDIFKGFVNRRHVTLTGKAERRLKLLGQDVDFYILNHEGFGIVDDHVEGMFDLIIVDEAAVYRNQGTARFKVLDNHLYRVRRQGYDPRLWLMTGTPTPNSPVDAWTLSKFVKNPDSPSTESAFKDQVMYKLSGSKYVPRPNCEHVVRRILQPSVRYERAECFDLPETLYQVRHAPLSTEQSRMYKEMVKNAILLIESGETITALMENTKMLKLVQITCGVAYDDTGAWVNIDCGPRLKVLKEVIEEVGSKVIIFAPLTGTIHMLRDFLAKDYTVGLVDGKVSAARRDEIFANFQNKPDPHILLAHPKTMAHGLTLTAASTIIWYGPTTSNEVYTQANGRIERYGKVHNSLVVHIESTEIERRIYSRLASKQRIQGLLLDLIKSGRKDVYT